MSRKPVIVRPIISGNTAVQAEQVKTNKILDQSINLKTKLLYDSKTRRYLEWVKNRNNEMQEGQPTEPLSELTFIPCPDDEDFVLNELTPM
jgi:hypothetical protein